MRSKNESNKSVENGMINYVKGQENLLQETDFMDYI